MKKRLLIAFALLWMLGYTKVGAGQDSNLVVNAGLPEGFKGRQATGVVHLGTNALQASDVTFKAECDGTEQHYVLILPSGFKSAESHDVLIALHGHGSDRWQFARDARAECRAARDVAAEHRMLYVTPDYRAKTSWMGPKAEADVVQIIGELKQQFKIKRVFLCGASMGGMACLTFTALHPKLVDGVASMNGLANLMDYTNFSDAIAASFGGSKTAIPEEYQKRSAGFWLERFTMPVGITASGKDDIVPPQSVLLLAKTLKAQGRDVMLIYRPQSGHWTAYDDATAIIEFVIQKAPP
jgi:pimeloyl-ACP methyl ester carboxylesterase